MSNEKRGLLQLLLDLQDLVAQEQPGLLVKRGERLVHQQDLWLRRQRARHGHPLPHAARQLGGIPPLESLEPHELDELPRPLVPLGSRQAHYFQRKRDVIDQVAPREGRFLLEDHADRRMRPAHSFARNHNRAVIAVEQAADDVEQRRLAAARWADHADEFARRDGEGYVIDRGEDAVRSFETLDNILDDQNGISGREFRLTCVNALRVHGSHFLSALHAHALHALHGRGRPIARPDNHGRCLQRRIRAALSLIPHLPGTDGPRAGTNSPKRG